MTAFEPDKSIRWLFCMTHPDDEISICAWIKRLSIAGNDVFISWTHHTPVRKEEAIRAAGLLGVSETRLTFHNGGDGCICDQMQGLVPSFKDMMADVNPDRIVCGAFEQGHLDHDATNQLVNLCFNGPVFEVPFYHTYLTKRPRINRFADPNGQEVLQLTAEEQNLKTKMATLYPSQAIWRNLLLDEARRRLTARGEEPLRKTERMRRQTHFEFLSPNLPEPLATKVKRSVKWVRWEAAVRAIL